MKMVQTANLGYDKEHVITFANDTQLAKNLLSRDFLRLVMLAVLIAFPSLGG